MTRRRNSRGRPPPVASYRPHRCLVLAVDTGNRSGWSIWVCGQLVAWGECDSELLAEVRQVVELAFRLAEGLPCVLVHEHHPWQGRQGAAAGLRASRKVWVAVWRDLGGAARRVVGVHPSTWRSRTTGVTRPTEAARQAEQRRARMICQAAAEHVGVDSPPGPDASPAIVIGEYGCRAGEVAKVIPALFREAA